VSLDASTGCFGSVPFVPFGGETLEGARTTGPVFRFRQGLRGDYDSESSKILRASGQFSL
jgi:hypothetical protein